MLRDHLGNTRVTFKDGTNKGAVYYDWATYTYIDPNQGNTGYNDGVVGVSDIKQINNYYPFGLNMEGNWNGAAGANKYQYNGKQWNDDFSLGWNDYGARFYAPDAGRWVNVDPMTESQESYSPYHYALDNPIKNNDPDGREPNDIVIRGQNGSSVTLKTDLINIDVNASSLGVNFGGNYTVSGDDILQAGLDIVGIFDPTPVSDGINAAMSAKKGDWGDVIISSLGFIPYAGDLAKVGKIEKDIKILENAVGAVKNAEKSADAGKSAKDLLREGRSGKQERLKELANDSNVSKSDKGWIKQEQNQIDRGKRDNIRNPPNKVLAHERGREAAKGYSYKYSNLQDKGLHKTQHKYDKKGKSNKERPLN